MKVGVVYHSLEPGNNEGTSAFSIVIEAEVSFFIDQSERGH